MVKDLSLAIEFSCKSQRRHAIFMLPRSKGISHRGCSIPLQIMIISGPLCHYGCVHLELATMLVVATQHIPRFTAVVSGMRQPETVYKDHRAS
jgi:hypothetical protein